MSHVLPVLPSGGLEGKEFTYNAAELALIPGSGRYPGEGNGR